MYDFALDVGLSKLVMANFLIRQSQNRAHPVHSGPSNSVADPPVVEAIMVPMITSIERQITKYCSEIGLIEF